MNTYMLSLKIYNEKTSGGNAWCIPKRGSEGYEKVKKMQARLDKLPREELVDLVNDYNIKRGKKTTQEKTRKPKKPKKLANDLEEVEKQVEKLLGEYRNLKRKPLKSGWILSQYFKDKKWGPYINNLLKTPIQDFNEADKRIMESLGVQSDEAKKRFLRNMTKKQLALLILALERA